MTARPEGAPEGPDRGAVRSPRESGEARQDGTAARPLPQPDAVSRPYWEAAARGELLIQECAACGHRQFYPRAACTACGAEPGWVRASGRGVVHTFTVIRQNPSRPFRDMLPYVVAVIELEEGVRMMSNVTGCAPEDVRIGMPVEVHMLEVEPELAIPLWRPAAT